MKVRLTRRFERDYARLSEDIKARAEKQIALLLADPRHVSLNIKKMGGYESIWEGRITRSYRFTFQITEDTYTLRRIGTHDILLNP
jgi:mRNA-degrading endonuclease RelE of RelBE toxin-antitoxin system